MSNSASTCDSKARPVGLDRGMVIPPSFFEPLPKDLLDAFRGKGRPCPADRGELHKLSAAQNADLDRGNRP